MKNNLLVIGITGGIGSGKSEVCRLFESLGARVLYADSLARELANTNTSLRNRIIREFGPEAYLPDRTLNRKAIAKIVFRDESARRRLEEILHPFTVRKLEEQIERERRLANVPLLCVEAALLYEASIEHLFDYTIVVDAPERTRISRVMMRESISESEVLERIRSQMPAAEKADRADFVLKNTGDLPHLAENCKFLFSLLVTLKSNSLDPSHAK